MIEIRDLHKAFKKNHILKGVNLQVPEGRTLAIIGPSGSGKSTLLRCMNLLETGWKGEIRLDDLVINGEKLTKETILAARRNTAMVFQHYNLFANKTALENIAEALITVKKKQKKEAWKTAEEALDKVGLLSRRDHYPSGLSGGQQQRVAIARALVLKPKAILLDEPTSALDPELVREVLQVIQIAAKEKVTMVIVTHEMEFAREVAHEIAFMNEGVIVEQKEATDFFLHPKEERTKKFIEDFRERAMYYI